MPTGRPLRVRAVQPVRLTAPAGSLTAVPLCDVTLVEGPFERLVGDTLVFRRVDQLKAAAGADRSSRSRCTHFEGAATLVGSPHLALAERRIHRGRTAALVIGTAAVLIAFAAYGASQIDYSFPPSSGGF